MGGGRLVFTECFATYLISSRSFGLMSHNGAFMSWTVSWIVWILMAFHDIWFQDCKMCKFAVLLGRTVGDWDHDSSITVSEKKTFNLLII